MSLEPGTKLGQYEISAPLGEGGMGAVYRALDKRLNRLVAIKVLSNDLADADARRRFQREAQMASALNHPHILTVYDAGEFEGRQYLVMEFVDGTTLKGWVRAEQRTGRQIAELLLGVADGLAAAHAAGILHRDVKPENVLVAKNGYAKLADFGLAKLFEPVSERDVTRTITQEGTKPGVVMGTIAYMSPEQAAGRSVDARSDIFSFGIVLHEVLVGRRPFRGASELEVLQAILHGAPVRLSSDVPVALRAIVEKALEKNPADRYQTMRDLVVDLRRFSRQTAEAPAIPVLPTAAGARRLRPRVAAAAAVGLALGFAAGRPFWIKPVPSRGNVQFQRITDFIGIEESPAISPDGKTIAFVAQAGAWRQIWIRLLAGGIPLQVTHDDADHEQPRWAPDSSALIYYSPAASPGADGTIWEVSALGGAPRRITTAVTAGDINREGHIAAFQAKGEDVELVDVARDGSSARSVARLKGNYDRPRWSPDARWIAFHRGLEDVFNDAIYVVTAGGGTPREVVHADSMRGLSWLPDSSGFVYSSSEGSTILYPPVFNLRMVGRDGGRRRQLTFGDASYVEPDTTASGRVAASRMRIQSDIWKFSVTGSPEENTRNAVRITQQTGQAQTPSVSPDGLEVVFLSDSGGHGNLWIAKTDGSAVRQITFEHDPSVVIGVPIWSPVSTQIVFILTRNGKTGEWLVNSDGSGLHQFVEHGSGALWSADGRWLYYARGACIEKVPLQGGPALRVRCEQIPLPLGISSDGATFFYSNVNYAGYDLRRSRPESSPSESVGLIPASRIPVDRTLWQVVLSPDDKWLAAPLIDRGTTNLWLMPSGGGPLRMLTDFGARSTVIMRRISWSPDGKALYAALADTDADIALLDGLLP
jgi:eukaryotic-like serine/threonine-protein kinase